MILQFFLPVCIIPKAAKVLIQASDADSNLLQYTAQQLQYLSCWNNPWSIRILT